MAHPSRHSIFFGLTEDQLQQLLAFGVQIQLEEDSIFIHEGASERTFYYINEGAVEIFRFSGNQNHVLAVLKPGETVGELALVDDAPRSTSVKALHNSKVYQFDIDELRKNHELADLYAFIMQRVGKQLSKRLRFTNDVTVAALKNKFAMSIFSIRMLVLLSFYALSLNLIEKSKQYLPNTTLLSIGLILIFTLVLLSIVRRSGYPWSFYGVRRGRLFRKTLEAIFYSIPVMAVVLLIKWLAISYIPDLHSLPLFDHTATFKAGLPFNINIYFISMFFYALFCPVQEFMVRGCVQTSLQNLLTGSSTQVKWNAILISNLIFSSAHAHTSLGFALITFIPGLFWGWLFYRQKSLIGVCVSHILIGVWAVFIIGFNNII